MSLDHINKNFGRITAVNKLSLRAEAGELITLLGPSGCGKTTTLKIIAGLEQPTSGSVVLGDRDITRERPERRSAVLVFQRPLLFPFMTVAENVAFGLRMKRVSRGETSRRVADMLSLVQLQGFGRRRPSELSGGQQQRVALARALVLRPDVLLLDEPLSNLDESLRDEMRDLVRTVHRRAGVTTVFVTHDQEEATVLSDRIGLMIEGRLIQFADPRELYEKPASVEIASFLGNRNHIPGEKRGSVVHTVVGKIHHRCDGVPDGPVHVLIRPEAIQFARRPRNSIEATIKDHKYLGTHSRCVAAAGDRFLDIIGDAGIAGSVDSRVWLYMPADRLWLVQRDPTAGSRDQGEQSGKNGL